MQTILGSGGAIGIELAKALKEYTDRIRLVSRNPKKVNDSDEILAADLLEPSELERAIQGSKIVYVTVGFPYSHKIWNSRWPPFINNLLDLCQKEGCKLVFFDNIYMYGKDSLNPAREDSTEDPPSKKGKVRKQIAGMIMDRAKSGKLQALIARSADFYGPSIENSVLLETVFKPLAKGKPANLLMSDSVVHSYTFIPDAGKATALLGNTEKAYGQIWHLPTASDPLTGKQWVEAFAQRMGMAPRYRVASKSMVRLLGLFMPLMRESVEMLYQYDRDYVFDSSKFEKEFNWKPTPYGEGIRQIIASDFQAAVP